jgi:hypothetical protein
MADFDGNGEDIGRMPNAEARMPMRVRENLETQLDVLSC